MSHPNSKSKTSLATLFPFSMRDLIVTALILFVAVAFCILLQRLDPSAGFATPVFVLTVLLTSRLTTGYFWGLFSAVLGVIAVNFFFTFPLLGLQPDHHWLPPVLPDLSQRFCHHLRSDHQNPPVGQASNGK